MLRKMKLFLLLLLGSVLVLGCGQKGPLYKSPEPQDNQVEVVQPVEQTQQTQDIQPTSEQSQ